MYGSVIDTQI